MESGRPVRRLLQPPGPADCLPDHGNVKARRRTIEAPTVELVRKHKPSQLRHPGPLGDAQREGPASPFGFLKTGRMPRSIQY